MLVCSQVKYMYLAAQSKFKGQQDFLKYEKARKLKVSLLFVSVVYFFPILCFARRHLVYFGR